MGIRPKLSKTDQNGLKLSNFLLVSAHPIISHAHLEFGCWSFSGAWLLRFGASPSEGARKVYGSLWKPVEACGRLWKVTSVKIARDTTRTRSRQPEIAQTEASPKHELSRPNSTQLDLSRPKLKFPARGVAFPAAPPFAESSASICHLPSPICRFDWLRPITTTSDWFRPQVSAAVSTI